MIFDRSPVFLVAIFCLITIYSLFSIKEEVMNMSAELQEVEKQVENERNSISILKAEFSYLTSPQRLANLNNRYIGLKETQLAQIKHDLNDNIVIASSKTKANYRASNVKWRYKKGPEKYITLVSAKRKK